VRTKSTYATEEDSGYPRRRPACRRPRDLRGEPRARTLPCSDLPSTAKRT